MAFIRLLLLSLALLLGTALAAFLPLHFRLSPRSLHAVSTFSTGLLVGAALTIVIPEGVEAVFESTEHGAADGPADEHGEENAGWIGAALLAGFLLMYILDSLHGHDSYPDPSHTHHAAHSSPSSSPPLSSRYHRPLYRPTPSHLAELEPLSHGAGRDSHEYARSSTEAWDEEAGQGAGGRARSPLPGGARTPGCSGDEKHLITADASSVSTVLGLLAHSLADGISLGASSLSSSSSSSSSSSLQALGEGTPTADSSLQLIVFLAIMLHKAPTAFALSSLLSASPATSPAFVRRALALFALAAPVGAIATYLLLSAVGGEGGAKTEWWTGLTLVFSGGTFLFVATHAVKEQEKKATAAAEAAAAGSVAGDEGDAQPGPIGHRARMALVVVGMVTPGVLSRLVGHGH
ncbi:hypothetical protein JCM8097_007961 [Rhodosporidiobolus ruineniae]